MLNTGAYSKKYQHLAREMRETQQRASKSARDRAQLLSKQTAQRQKALEEKKRAMALAEEERRRRALEERRKTQQEATMRFKSAISRLKAAGASKEQVAAPGREMHVQFYMPDQPWAGISTTKSSATQNERKLTQQKTRERVVTGREVEVAAREAHQGLQRRTPSLDDVLRAVRGGTSCPSAEPPAQYAHTSSQGPAALGGPLREKSDSDTILDAQSTPSGFSQQSGSQSRHGHSVQDTNSNTLQPSLAAPQEGVVFHPVLKRAPPLTAPRDELQVVSPETPDSGDSPADSLSDSGSSAALQDSLDVAMAGMARHRQCSNQDSPFTEGMPHGQPHSSHIRSSAPQQPRPHDARYKEDSDSSSSSDCYDHAHKHTPPRSRRHARISRTAGDPLLSSSGEEAGEPRLVGILKKPGSGSQSSKPPSGPSSACHSQAGSTLSSAMDQCSSHGGASEVGRMNKRVRFRDQVNCGESSVTPALDPSSFQAQLWSRVFHNGFSTRFPPNSAFTPKMRLSLSSKATITPRKSPTTPPNGVTVHMPTTEGESSARAAEARQAGSTAQRAELHGDTSHSSMEEGPAGLEQELEQATVAPGRGIPLDKTPTDDDINDLWAQIRAYLQSKEKVSVLPQVFRFLPEELEPVPEDEDQGTQPGRPPQLSQRQKQAPGPPGGLAQKQLVHRQHQPRPLRCQHQLHQPVPHWQRTSHPHPGSPAHRRLQVSSREPQQALKATGTSIGKRGPATALSLEEQRIEHSIAELNRRLRDHSRRDPRPSGSDPPACGSARPPTPPTKIFPHPPTKQFPYPPMRHPPHPPTRHPSHPPHSVGSRGPGGLPKTRVRRDPRSIAMAAALRAQALDSRSQPGTTAHRQLRNS